MFFVFLLTFHGVFAVSTENPLLEYKMISNGTFLMLNKTKFSDPITILEKYPLNIAVHSNIYITNVSCGWDSAANWNSRILHPFKRVRSPWDTNGIYFTINNFKTINRGCLLITPEREYFLPLHFHIRTKQPVTCMYVNNYEVYAASTDLSLAYDAVAYYTFAVGETAVIDCKLRYEENNAVTSYYDNTEMAVFVQRASSVGLQSRDRSSSSSNPLSLKLTETFDKKFLKCVYDISITHLVFKMQTPETPKSIITLKINGMIVNIRPSNNTNYYYDLFYHDGEIIDLVVGIQSAENSSLLVNYHGIEHFLSNFYRKKFILKKENDGNVLQILATDTQLTRENLTIAYVHRLSDLFLTDINKGNILKEYRNIHNTSFVYYQYSATETFSIVYSNNLVLDCPESKFNESETTDSRFPMKRVVTVTLHPENDGSNIHCMVNRLGGEVLEQVVIKLLYKQPTIIEYENTRSWIAWIVSLLFISVIIGIVAFVIRKRMKEPNKQCSVTNNVPQRNNLPLQFANMSIFPDDGREQEPIPVTCQETYHCQCVQSNETTTYSEIYYEPSFPKDNTSNHIENEYIYADCEHLGERHASAFDAVTTKIALEKARKMNKSEYMNLKEVCRPGHCVMRLNVRK